MKYKRRTAAIWSNFTALKAKVQSLYDEIGNIENPTERDEALFVVSEQIIGYLENAEKALEEME